MKKTFISILLILISISASSQARCGTYEYENYLRQKYPDFGEALDKTREESFNASKLLNKADDETVYYIPVVFHLVWNTPDMNLHDSFFHSQIKTFNEAFNHNHKDTNKVRTIFKPVAGNARIVFYLAKKDPDGMPTNGIHRVKTTKADFGGNDFYAESVKLSSEKGADAWDPEKYLNIWVCRFTYQGNMVIGAYGYPPVNAKFWSSNYYKDLEMQGVVVNYPYIGVKNPNDVSNNSMREKTLIHEVGHYLGLRHIWADKKNVCTGEDDGFKDTPLCSSQSTNCSISKNTCNEGTGDKPDMYENYMDYSIYPCTIMFTKEQVAQMRWNLLNLRAQVGSMSIDNTIPASAFVNIYPNPSKNSLTIDLDKKGNYSIIITDILGQQLGKENFTVLENFQFKYNTSYLSSGIYYIKIIYDNKKVLSQKLIIQ